MLQPLVGTLRGLGQRTPPDHNGDGWVNISNWWTTQGLVPTNVTDSHVNPPQKLKTPEEVATDVYYDLLGHDPNQRWSGLSEADVEELRGIMTEMDGVAVTVEVAWSTARSVLELVRLMLTKNTETYKL